MNPTIAPLAAGAITAAATIAKGETPRLRIVFGSVFGAVMLGLLARPLPGFARALAGLIIIGTMLGPGYDVIRALQRLITNP